MAIKKEIENVNDKWCEYLKTFWINFLYNKESNLRLIAEKLSFAVTPIAILPFDKRYLYSKYIALPSEANELERDKYKLLVRPRRPKSSEWREIPLAIGL